MSGEDTARAALRARQGAGARYDAAAAPQDDLLLARRATAFFARRLNALDDASLCLPIAGQTRARVVAHVAYEARALAIALKALRGPLEPDEAAWRADLALAETLPPRALRHLFDHAAKHLDVEWRDLDGAGWSAALDLAGVAVVARDTPRRHALTLWRGAFALDNGARPGDVPEALRAGVGVPGVLG